MPGVEKGILLICDLFSRNRAVKKLSTFQFHLIVVNKFSRNFFTELFNIVLMLFLYLIQISVLSDIVT